MKNYFLLLLFIISHFAFGQDSTFVTTDKNHIFLKLSGIQPGVNSQNTITKIKNTYVLNQSEKDSIWQQIYMENSMQSFLKNFRKSKSNELYQPQNLLQLMALLNNNSVDYKTKRNLFIGKIEFDKKRANVDENPYQTFGRCGLDQRPQIEEITSKKKAIDDYINFYKDQKTNFFQLPSLTYIGVNYKKTQPIVAVYFLKREQTTYKKTIKHMRYLNIKHVDLINGLMVYYDEK